MKNSSLSSTKSSLHNRIQQLDKQVAQQITSQQIIPTLHQCIKQLIDNSIDANSNFIKIILNEYGKQSILIYDNGSGIKDVQKLEQGGNTSKLFISQNNLNNQKQNKELKQTQDYLQGVRTLGFRGQAVNSIAKLCKQMTIHTVFQDKKQDNKLKQVKYSVTQRKIISQKQSIFIQTCTRIQILNLFHTLPVRRYQLQNKPKQNIKKVYQLIFEISLIYPEITFILINQVKGKEQSLFQVHRTRNDNNKYSAKKNQSQTCSKKENIKLQDNNNRICKYKWLQRIQQCYPQKFDSCLLFIQNKNIQGYILNTIDSGSSRKNLKFPKNFQYLFINRRPINLIKQIVKLFDSFYKKYNPYTKYVFFLNLKVEPKAIDINLSPNKRDILIKKKVLDQIIEQIKQCIQKNVIEKVNHMEEFKQLRQKKNLRRTQSKNEQFENQEEFQRVKSIEKPNSQSNSQNLQKVQKMQIQIPVQQQKRQYNHINPHQQIRNKVFRSLISQDKQQKLIEHNFLGNYQQSASTQQLKMNIINQLNRRSQANTSLDKLNKTNILNNGVTKQKNQKDLNPIQKFLQKQKQKQKHNQNQNQQQSTKNNQKIILNRGDNQNIITSLNNAINMNLNKKILSQAQKIVKQQVQQIKNKKSVQRQKDLKFDINKKLSEKSQLKLDTIKEVSKQSKIQLQQQKINTSIKEQQFQCQQQMIEKQQKQVIFTSQNKFSPQILQKLKLNYVTTQQQKKQLLKNDFKNFHIYGQFNKGFILCSENQNNCFYIVDQHAAEEKRLFQDYIESKPTFLHVFKQVHITPLQVDLIQSARHQLQSSGFKFQIRNRQTLIIIRSPTYFKKNFGLQQFTQIFQTNKNIKQLPIFYNSAASKACRTAVMIGDQINKNKMKQIVHKMSELKSPWNCPHGRPSLISLGGIKGVIQKIEGVKTKYKF